jgi:uncharacterized protein (TIGR02265 family)
MPEEKAMYEIGRSLIAGYRETMVGRAVTATARLIGPLRTLERFARSLKTVNNFGESQTQRVGPQHVRIVTRPARFPSYYEGVFKEIMSGLGFPDAQVATGPLQGEELTIDVRW